MRRLWQAAVLVCVLCLALAACAGNKSSSSAAATPAPSADDDDDGSPAPIDPWNENYPRPLVTIASPQPGAFVTGSSVTIKGSVSGATVTEVTIGDRTAPVVDGVFEYDAPLAADQVVEPFYITAASSGDVVEPAGAARLVVFRGDMADPKTTVTDAAELALGNDALTAVDDLIGKSLSALDLMPLFNKLNPIINIAGVTVDVTAASIDAASGEAAFLDTGLGFQGALSAVTLGLKITIAGTATNMSTTIGQFDFHGLVDLGVAAGKATASVSDFTMTQSDISFSGPLPDIIGAELVNLLLGGIEDVVKAAVNGLLPPLAEAILNALSIKTTLDGWDLQFALSNLQIVAGALVAQMDMNAYVVSPDPTLPWPQGSLAVGGSAPDMINGRPAAAQAFGFGAALSADVLNRFLFAAADAKLLNLTVSATAGQGTTIPLALTAGTMALLFPSLGAVDPSTPVSLVLTPMTPPVALAAADGSLTLRIPDYRMDLYLDPKGYAPWRAMELSIDAAFAVNAAANAGKLQLSFPSLAFNFYFIDNPLNDDASLASFLQQWLPGIIQEVLNLVFDAMPIKLPAIAGISAAPEWWGAAGSELDYWTFYFGMSYAPPSS